MQINWKTAIAGVVLASTVAAPSVASAQSWRDLERALDRRQSKKNEWRNIAIASGAVGILGLIQKDNTLFFAGTAGALYSAYRYEQDRKSQNQLQRTRAAYFSRPYFIRDGWRYNRKVKNVGGKRYFYFQRAGRVKS